MIPFEMLLGSWSIAWGRQVWALRLGAVLDVLHLGSSLSLRSFARFGSALALCGRITTAGGNPLSVLDAISVGSAMSLRSFPLH